MIDSSYGGYDNGARDGCVLVVDNELPQIRSIQEALESVGVVCLTASTGAQALSRLRCRQDILVVVTDIRMPEMDGFDLIETIRGEWQEADRPAVVVVSGFLDQQATMQALRTGVHDCLAKPFSREELLESVLRCQQQMQLKRLQRDQARAVDQMLLRICGELDQTRLQIGTIGAPQRARVAGQGDPGPDGRLLNEEMLKDRVLAIVNWWRQLGESMDNGFMASPAWTILLETYAHSFENRSSYITGLAISAGVPLSTASRHALALEARGLVERHSDPADGRRTLLRLTAAGAELMRRCVSQLELSNLPN